MTASEQARLRQRKRRQGKKRIDYNPAVEVAKDVDFLARMAAEYGPHLGLTPDDLLK